MKFCELITDQLVGLGYTHFFFVGGGNIMHLTGALAKKLTPIPVIHEVAAVIASEYFNEVSDKARALALVTAGPGLTNALTGIAGSYLESRGTLIIGGQVKTEDLATGGIRQRGIQEIDGVSICKPITKLSIRLDNTISESSLAKLFDIPFNGRSGPVFVEIPLNVQAAEVIDGSFKELNFLELPKQPLKGTSKNSANVKEIVERFKNSSRPLILLGGGVTRKTSEEVVKFSEKLGVPVATTWNAADRVDSNSCCYVGRPNTWGQRSSNIIIQQSDLVIALGTRLGLQQTGFNWQEFVPVGDVVMVDIDQNELNKGHPNIAMPVLAEVNELVEELLPCLSNAPSNWLKFCQLVRSLITLDEKDSNLQAGDGFVTPFELVSWLSDYANQSSLIVPCSSGSAFTCMMQGFLQKSGQILVTNKGLASMGYGLSGAIGAAISSPNKQVFLVEGDGGFSQNLQELGTVSSNNLNIKIFIFDDSGHASIRMTQKNYFNGVYVGCDRDTGLGLPDWENIGKSWGITTNTVTSIGDLQSQSFQSLLSVSGPAIFIVRVHPEQTYFPKIASKITTDGGMMSAALHDMTPKLDEKLAQKVFKYIPSP